jgi:hypothetical protein
MDLHDRLVKKAEQCHQYGTLVHVTIIVLGAVSAAQASVKDQMGVDSGSVIFFFSILAILMTISAGMESFFKWNHKSGAFYSLAAVCDAFRYRMHDEWHRAASEYTAQPNQDNLDRVLKLARDDLEDMNRKITAIQNRAAELGVPDLALKPDSLGAEDMFGVPLAHKRVVRTNGRNGRPSEGKSSLSV